ncbi:hypothetical protein Dimus_018132, partial [Dionaea muscipula]
VETEEDDDSEATESNEVVGGDAQIVETSVVPVVSEEGEPTNLSRAVLADVPEIGERCWTHLVPLQQRWKRDGGMSKMLGKTPTSEVGVEEVVEEEREEKWWIMKKRKKR